MVHFPQFEVLEVDEPNDKIIVKITIYPYGLGANEGFLEELKSLAVGSDVVLGNVTPTVGKVEHLTQEQSLEDPEVKILTMKVLLLKNLEVPSRAINEWVLDIHEYAKNKGWWDNERTPLEIHMLCVTEIAEASEAVRNNEHYAYGVEKDSEGKVLRQVPLDYMTPSEIEEGTMKLEGEAAELADCVIRVMDYFGRKGWDLEKTIKAKHAYNLNRPYRHGGKAL